MSDAPPLETRVLSPRLCSYVIWSLTSHTPVSRSNCASSVYQDVREVANSDDEYPSAAPCGPKCLPTRLPRRALRLHSRPWCHDYLHNALESRVLSTRATTTEYRPLMFNSDPRRKHGLHVLLGTQAILKPPMHAMAL